MNGTYQNKNLNFPGGEACHLFLSNWCVPVLYYWGLIILMARKHKLPPFVPLTWQMLRSNAYLNLKPNSAKALPFFLGKGKVKHTLQEFTFSYTEAKVLGFSRSTFKRIISDLTGSGFIKITVHGGLKGFEKSYSKYRLIEEWKAVGSGLSIEQSKNGHWQKSLQPSKVDL